MHGITEHCSMFTWQSCPFPLRSASLSFSLTLHCIRECINLVIKTLTCRFLFPYFCLLRLHSTHFHYCRQCKILQHWFNSAYHKRVNIEVMSVYLKECIKTCGLFSPLASCIFTDNKTLYHLLDVNFC